MPEHHIECSVCGCYPSAIGPGAPCALCKSTRLHYHCAKPHLLCDNGCWPKVSA